MRPPSFRHRLRLTWTLALLAWFAQLCLPVAHAATMAQAPRGAMAAWCGDPAGAREALAALPAEIRDALALDALGVDALAACAQLCAVGHTPAPPPAPAAAPQPAPADRAMARSRHPAPVPRRHALPPPSHAPPARA